MKVKEFVWDNYRARGYPLQTHTRLTIPNNRQKKNLTILLWGGGKYPLKDFVGVILLTNRKCLAAILDHE